jgi:CubicO group peptidase (beta-lactamase class C family)
VDKWLKAALDYIPDWIAFQLRLADQPGCVIAIVHHDRIVLEEAFGQANLITGEKLTSRHRFRVASHSKSFTAAGVMKLREQGKLKLDDAIGDYVEGLNSVVATATIGQILSHSAGIIRDGTDSGQFVDRRPYLTAKELLDGLSTDPPIEPNTRFKYSNHGFGLVGLLIEKAVGEPYRTWIKREIIDAAGLHETDPDMPIAKGAPFAQGHSTKLLLGERVLIPGDYSTNAIAPAAGFVATARDLARFFGELSPGSKRSVLSVASRREMTRRQWRNPQSSAEEYYGLGVKCGTLSGWDWFGHGGSLHGYISCTSVVPEQDLTICALTNVNNGWAGPWVDGAINILRTFAQRGPPSRRLRDWTGRWWGMGGAVDFVPSGGRVLMADPAAWNPFLNTGEIEVRRKDEGLIALANGYASHGEDVRHVRGKSGSVREVWLAGWKLQREATAAAEMRGRYQVVPAIGPVRPRTRKTAQRQQK